MSQSLFAAFVQGNLFIVLKFYHCVYEIGLSAFSYATILTIMHEENWARIPDFLLIGRRLVEVSE